MGESKAEFHLDVKNRFPAPSVGGDNSEVMNYTLTRMIKERKKDAHKESKYSKLTPDLTKKRVVFKLRRNEIERAGIGKLINRRGREI